MSAEALGFSGIVALLILLVLRVPVAFAMFLVGFLGIWALNGWNGAMGLLSSETFTLASSSELVVVPLFILMGNVASTTGMSRQLYNAAYAVIGHIRGGLASATLLGCGGFAALSGSSVASALTMGKVSLSEMDRYGYDPRLSTGVVAAGGTLGILIPPSTGFVIFAILTEQSIGRLFLAGVFPGLLLLAIFVITVSIICWFRPEAGPPGLRRSLSEKLTALTGALPILLVIASTIGGIYGGLFSPVEAAGVGAAFVIIYGIVTRSLSLSCVLAGRAGLCCDHSYGHADLDRRPYGQPIPRPQPCANLCGRSADCLRHPRAGHFGLDAFGLSGPGVFFGGVCNVGAHTADIFPGGSANGY